MSNTFLKIKTKTDLAKFLNITEKNLDYNAYNIDKKYIEFFINKKSGGKRKILAPIYSLKSIQKLISKELLLLYKAKPHVHSYIPKRGIRTNAKLHVNQKYVLNLDLKDFFPSINFGRVYGLFLSPPFNFNKDIAAILAQLLCHKNELPQGSPTSPIISNLICRNLDNDIRDIAKKNKCYYTRYADDITFSTRLNNFPQKIAIFKNDKVKLSKDLKKIIINNGFNINNKKVSLRQQFERQYVTGLTVNTKLNTKRKFIKSLRAKLYAWEKFGLEKAALEHFKKYSTKHKGKTNPELFINIIEGKLLFLSDIRGKNDELFKSFLNKFESLKPGNSLSKYLSYQGEKIQLFTEGNTDWIHLKHALDSLCVVDLKYNNLRDSIKIIEYDPNYSVGDTKLKSILEGHLVSKNKVPIIALFDSDNISNLGEFAPKKEERFKSFGKSVFTFCLPKPTHRTITKNCIEHYYKDDDLKIKDENGRRLFLSDEFNKENGQLETNEELRYIHSVRKLKNSESIIDDGVRDKNDKSFALSKKDFAMNIKNKSERFKKVNVNSFRLIFDTLLLIIKQIHENNKTNSKLL